MARSRAPDMEPRPRPPIRRAREAGLVTGLDAERTPRPGRRGRESVNIARIACSEAEPSVGLEPSTSSLRGQSEERLEPGRRAEIPADPNKGEVAADGGNGAYGSARSV